MKSLSWTAAVAALIALTACSEKPQEQTGTQADGAAYQGTGVASFTQPGWTAGDANSWQQQLRARGQYGQNEYNRTQAK
ncbi:MAG: hypothetical protein Q4G70_00115 [Pseudomonadota bacterium]|nr:hypothetical protein [Pseudomonadota bacterium]